MLLAQLNRKVPSEFEGMEDVLTSSIFGLLRYLPTETACVLLAEFAGIELPPGPVQLKLWPRYHTPPGFVDTFLENTRDEELPTRGETEPDAVIVTKDWLVLLEAKYRSRLDDNYDQLGREFALGYREAKKDELQFRLLVVTSDTRQPMPGNMDLVSGIREALERASVVLGSEAEKMIAAVPNSLHWINWQSIYRILEETHRNRKYQDSIGRLLEDICLLLELRGLKPYDFLSIIRAMSEWEETEIPDEIWLSPITYRYITTASIAAGWEQLCQLDTSILEEPSWHLDLPLSSYDLVSRLGTFKLDLLSEPEWQPFF